MAPKPVSKLKLVPDESSASRGKRGAKAGSGAAVSDRSASASEKGAGKGSGTEGQGDLF